MRITTWNVNGIRAREAQLLSFLETDRPDVLCLQEIKAAPDQVPSSLLSHADYVARWYGERAYSGVAVLVRKGAFPEEPVFEVPAFDFETRVLTARLPGVTVASVYVPNGGKDYAAKLDFLGKLKLFAEERRSAGELILLGDMNVARTDMDVHPKERKPDAIGQRADERSLFDGLFAAGYVDVVRAQHPTDADLFTWWPPWRKMRERNIGWRIDYVVASAGAAAKATVSQVQASFGTSDHAPVTATFEMG